MEYAYYIVDFVIDKSHTSTFYNFCPYFLSLFWFRLSTQLQLYGYNSQLYRNFTDAMTRSQGVVAISLLIQVMKIFPYILVRV